MVKVPKPTRWQWVKIVTNEHNADHGVTHGWFPLHLACALFAAQYVEGDLGEQLWKHLQSKPPFSKWDLRSEWYIEQVLPIGQRPSFVGWFDG